MKSSRKRFILYFCLVFISNSIRRNAVALVNDKKEKQCFRVILKEGTLKTQ